MSEASKAYRQLAELCDRQFAIPVDSSCYRQLADKLELEERRTAPVETTGDLRALVQHVIDQQRLGFDVLASAAWDRVVEFMEAMDAKKTDA